MNGQPVSEDEARLKRRITEDLSELESVDKRRAEITERLTTRSRELARMRGLPFIRMESLRQELMS